MAVQGGLLQAALFGAVVEDLRSTGSNWDFKTVVRLGDPLTDRTYEVRGDWDAAANRGFIRHIQLLKSSESGEVGRAILASGWKMDANTGHWFAQSTETRNPDGGLLERFVFVEAAPEDPARLQALFKGPIDGNDPQRGQLKFQLVHDHLQGHSSILANDGQVQQVPLMKDQSEPQFISPVFRRAAWVCAIGAVLTLILIRVRKSRRTTG